jgi:hypothetical protein
VGRVTLDDEPRGPDHRARGRAVAFHPAQVHDGVGGERGTRNDVAEPSLSRRPDGRHPRTARLRPDAGSSRCRAPVRSVIASQGVPGRNAIAQGVSNVARGSTEKAGVLGAEGLAGREVLGTDVAGAEGPGVEEVQPTRAKAVSATSAAQMREADMAKRYRPAPSVLSAWANPGMPCEGPEQGRPRPLRASVSLRFSPAARRSRPRFRRPTSRRLCRPGRRDPGRRPDAGRGRRDASSPSRRE